MEPVTKPNVLIVDDDESILELLVPYLSRSGYTVTTAVNAEDALSLIDTDEPDIMVLDIQMPTMDGRELLRVLRANECWLPVILLTQFGDADERAMALTEGADDYLNKPHAPHELAARIAAVLRRTRRGQAPLSQSHQLTSGTLRLDRQARSVTVDGQRLPLTRRALALLEFMMLHPEELLTRDRILDAVWGWHFETGTRSVDARIAEIRKALSDNADQPRFIETVAGEGYRFIAEIDLNGAP